MAVDDAGLPLSLLKLEFDAPRPGKDKLPEERKSARWLRGLRECAEAARRLEGTQLVSVMDREADFFEMFAEQRRLGNIDILVRAKHSRKLSKTEKLFDSVRAAPVQGHRKLTVSRLSQRPKISKRKATNGRKERVADMEIRSVSLPPTSGGTAPLPVQVVQRAEAAGRGQTGRMILAYHGRRFVRRRRHAGRGLVRPEVAQTGIAR